MKLKLLKYLMDRLAFNGLLQYEWGHRLFNKMYGMRIRSGEFANFKRGGK